MLFGLDCLTTRIVLATLLEARVNIGLVCLPGRPTLPLHKTGRRRMLPMGATPAPTVAALAGAHGVEVWRVGDLDNPDVQHELVTVSADVVVVACYNRLIPAAVYAERACGGINLHPSVLPQKRGPDPLFWVFRDDDRLVGATVHALSDRFDAGPIIRQASIPKPDGIAEPELDGLLANLGASLLLESLAALLTGAAAHTDQANTESTWARHPRPDDFSLDAGWTAQHAMNFAQGIAVRSHPYYPRPGGQRLVIGTVHGWTAAVCGEPRLPPPLIALRFLDGWLIVTPFDSDAATSPTGLVSPATLAHEGNTMR